MERSQRVWPLEASLSSLGSIVAATRAQQKQKQRRHMQRSLPKQRTSSRLSICLIYYKRTWPLGTGTDSHEEASQRRKALDIVVKPLMATNLTKRAAAAQDGRTPRLIKERRCPSRMRHQTKSNLLSSSLDIQGKTNFRHFLVSSICIVS
jgi:hypothetical protein